LLWILMLEGSHVDDLPAMTAPEVAGNKRGKSKR
jgi:hypothetical protein